MEGFTIEVTGREETGKAASNRYRKQGLIPAVIYQHGIESIPGLMPYHQFVHTAEKAKISQVFLLKSQDSRIDGRVALVREIQRDYLSGSPIHVDFQALREDEEIEVEVGLNFKGEALGVKQEGGIMTASVHSILISCLPRDIPADLDVDVSALKLNSSLHAGEIVLPTGVRLITHAEEPVVSVAAPKAEAAAEVAATEVAEGAEGAEAGATPPAGGKAAAAPAAGKAEKGGDKK